MSDNPRIQIHRQNSSVAVGQKPYPAPEGGQKVIGSLTVAGAGRDVRLLVRPEAAAALLGSVLWGTGPGPQGVEQAGVLLGRYYRDSSRRRDVVWGEVSAVIPFDQALVRATGTTIEIPQTAWAKMLGEFVTRLDGGDLNLGWYHTHLGSASARFSSVDRETQRANYTGELSFGVVLNPEKRQWSVYCGPGAAECSGEIFVAEELFERYREPRITIRSSPVPPEGSGPAPSGDQATILQVIGSWIEKFGAGLARVPGRAPGSAARRAHPDPPPPRISVQEPSRPKITVLPRENTEGAHRAVEAIIFSAGAGDLAHPVQQDQDGLQIITSNITAVTESLAAVSGDGDVTSNARVTLNDDLTLEAELCRDAGNALIVVSRRPFIEAFTEPRVNGMMRELAATLFRTGGDAVYLLCVSSVPEKIRLVVIQIVKERAA